MLSDESNKKYNKYEYSITMRCFFKMCDLATEKLTGVEPRLLRGFVREMDNRVPFEGGMR